MQHDYAYPHDIRALAGYDLATKQGAWLDEQVRELGRGAVSPASRVVGLGSVEPEAHAKPAVQLRHSSAAVRSVALP